MFSIGLDHTAGIYSTDLGEKLKREGGGSFFFFIFATYQRLCETVSSYKATEEENYLGSFPHHTQEQTYTHSISSIMFL